jgi:hypothetical protein
MQLPWFLDAISVFSHYDDIVSIGQKLVCSIQFQPFLVLLKPPNGVFKSKVENNGEKASPCFRPF